MTPIRQQEIEWQFDTHSLLRVEGWLRQRAERGDLQLNFLPLVRYSDSYFDTSDWRFYRADYVLRARISDDGDATIVTLKSFGTRKSGLRVRQELSETLPVKNGRSMARQLSASNGAVGQRVRAVVGREKLQLLCEVVTQRQRVALRADGEPIAEIALDDITIPTDQRRLPFHAQRVEVELMPDLSEDTREVAERFVQELRRACKLSPAKDSKFHLGLTANRRTPQVEADLGSPSSTDELDEQVLCGDLALAVLREHFADFLANEPGARLGENPEAVHRMRVATRRLRAAISLFQDFLPEQARALRRELRWVGRALGAVRDCDVQMQRVQTWQQQDSPLRSAAEVWRAALEHQREQARAHLLRALNSLRYQRLVEDFTHLLRDPSHMPPAAQHLARREMPALLLKQYARVREEGDTIGPDSPAEDYHALRIQCKRLRYALECCQPLYDRVIARFVERLVDLQDALGEQQDACVAIQQLRMLLTSHAHAFGEETARALEVLLGQYEAQAEEIRRAFPAYYQRLKGKLWQRVQRELDRG